jgi:SAM-dependent methyltransferase
LDLVGAHVILKERRLFEARYGLDTEAAVLLDDLTLKGERKREGFYYAATPPRVIHALLANLSNVNDSVFVDFGSGKGLVLFVAAEYPFKSVIGVEFAQELHDIAEENIRKYHDETGSKASIHSVCADASTFPIPTDNCVLYFCNPFADSLMQDVVDNIGNSIRQHGQKVFILFHQLVEEESITLANPVPIFESAPFLIERPFRYRSAYERFLLKHLRLKVYESVNG